MKKLNFGITVEIPVDAIDVSPLNIRKFYDEETITELGQSLSEMGTIYPVIVEQTPGGRYSLFIGTRRLKAAKELKLEQIPALVVTGIDEQQKLIVALSENLQREDLTDFEEAWAILKLINDHKMPMKEVAKKIGKDESFLRRRIQLLSLPKEVQELVSRKRLALSHVDALMSVRAPEDQVEIAQAAAADGLSSDELMVLVQQELEESKKIDTGRKHRPHRWGREFNGNRLALKILKMVGYLKVIGPGAVGSAMSEDERKRVLAALEKLSSEAERIAADINRKREK